MILGRIKKSFVYSLLRSIRNRFKRTHSLQRVATDRSYPLVHLGSEYGGWTLVDHSGLHGTRIISAGLGEDASFDVEFANKYDAEVLIVDPTPRAVAHFEEIAQHFGAPRKQGYSKGGKQPIEAYDLSALGRESLKLDARALWNKTDRIKFFEPENPDYVSHTVVNYQRDYRDDTSYIEVKAVTIANLLEEHEIDAGSLQLIKLDIEGAEVEVLQNMMEGGIFPNQILVEFDELNSPSDKAFQRIDLIHETLNESGYRCIHTDGQANFLYVHKNFEPADIIRRH